MQPLHVGLLVGRVPEEIVSRLLDFFILHALDKEGKTGYSIKKHISRRFRIEVSFGTLYPHLHTLEEAGLIHGVWMPRGGSETLRKREYTVTEAGRMTLRAGVEALSEVLYRLHPDRVVRELPEDAERQPLAPLERALSAQGYTVRVHEAARGMSGAEHQLDLLATRRDNGRKEVIVEIAFSERSVEVSRVARLFYKAYDLNANRAVLIAIPRLTDASKRLSEFLRVEVLEADSIKQAAARLSV